MSHLSTCRRLCVAALSHHRLLYPAKSLLVRQSWRLIKDVFSVVVRVTVHECKCQGGRRCCHGIQVMGETAKKNAGRRRHFKWLCSGSNHHGVSLKERVLCEGQQLYSSAIHFFYPLWSTKKVCDGQNPLQLFLKCPSWNETSQQYE